MKIENETLRKYIQYKTSNYGKEDFLEEDLAKIKDVSLNQKNFTEELQEIDLSELSKIPNLEILSLQNFEINNQAIDKLKNCKNLKTLQLEVCYFDPNVELNIQQLENIIIKYCKIEDWRKIPLIKNVTIESGEKIDLEDLTNYEKVAELRLNNLEVHNFKKILEYKNLNKLNLDGSKVDDESVMEILKSNVEISHRDNAYPI